MSDARFALRRADYQAALDEKATRTVPEQQQQQQRQQQQPQQQQQDAPEASEAACHAAQQELTVPEPRSDIQDHDVVADADADEAELPEFVSAEDAQSRLPGLEWKTRVGTAGTALEQRRNSPIVELSLLLVSLCSWNLRRCYHSHQ